MDEHGYEHAKPTKPQKKAQQRVLPRRGIRYLMLRVRQQFLSRFELHTISENLCFYGSVYTPGPLNNVPGPWTVCVASRISISPCEALSEWPQVDTQFIRWITPPAGQDP